MCTPTQGVWQPAGCVSCELVCVCVSLVRVVIICLASTHTALVSSPSLAVLHLSTYLSCSEQADFQTDRPQGGVRPVGGRGSPQTGGGSGRSVGAQTEGGVGRSGWLEGHTAHARRSCE